MKSFAWMVGGVCAAAIGFLVWGAIRPDNLTARSTPTPVEDLARHLEDAWADHHTVA